MTTSEPVALCPRCGVAVPADAMFCPACGSPLAGALCLRCEAPLTPGALFCHRCGMPAGGQPLVPTPASQPRDFLPWTIGGIALLALLALAIGRSMTRDQGPPVETGSFGAPTGIVRGTDISQMSPEEAADRLYNRVMALASQGKRDSVAFFAPMAIQAYGMLGPLSDDQHYDVGRIAEAAGALPLARAHADSVLARSPNHLLGLVLAARVAELERNARARDEYERRLLAAQASEMRKGLSEYERHGEEIAAAVAAARGRAGAR